MGGEPGRAVAHPQGLPRVMKRSGGYQYGQDGQAIEGERNVLRRKGPAGRPRLLS